MYPNLYYVFKDLFGVEWTGLSLLNTFGLMVALSFVGAAITLTSELKRKEKQGLLQPREETVTVGEGAGIWSLLLNGAIGFFFGYKILGALVDRSPEIPIREYIFSGEGNILGGLLLGGLMAFLKWKEKEKQKLKKPEQRQLRIWPHDRVGDFVILAMVFGILGAKLFDNLENPVEFLADPIGRLFSTGGLTFYGGLITAAVAICIYASRKGIRVSHLVDAAAPGLMLAYAIGRIGCQVAGDGDWGIYNSAYMADESGNISAADPSLFRQRLAGDSTYFLQGKVQDPDGSWHYVSDRSYPSLGEVPHASFRGKFMPNWFFAYAYPGNVNKDGIIMPGNTEEHNRMLPQPVFPTPLYETIICLIFFFIMWLSRKKIKTPLMMFGLYLILNGMERFMMEKIRVNKLYDLGGFQVSQAGLIAMGLIASGFILIFWAGRNKKTDQ